MDFLVHEGVVTALDGGGGVPGDLPAVRLGHYLAGGVGNFNASGGDQHDLVIVHLHGLLGEGYESGDVGTNEVFALAHTQNQRGGATRGHDSAGGVSGDG